MHARSHIDDKTMEYLTPEDPKPGRFYLLPKIHKENNPGRPIVSANGHPTSMTSFIPIRMLIGLHWFLSLNENIL
jgi:hypothetical protein